MVLKLVLSRAMNSSLHTQFARIGSCTFLSWSRADGEDSGLPEECLGRGTESVDPTLLVGAFTDFTGLPSGSRKFSGFPYALISLDGPEGIRSSLLLPNGEELI